MPSPPPAPEVAPKAIYLNPLLQNPTTATLPRTRREAIIAVARRYAVAIIEDDAYARICPTPPPSFAELAPEITYYVAGLAKCLGAGLRLAFLVAPSARSALPLGGALRAATVMASPIATALATRWITDGTAEAVVQFVRAESAARQRIATAILPAGTYTADPHAFHLWITLPEGWTRSAFASQGRSAGLGVIASDPFCVAGTPPEAVRLCLGGPSTRQQITHGLEVLAHVLEGSPALASSLHLNRPGRVPVKAPARSRSSGWTAVQAGTIGSRSAGSGRQQDVCPGAGRRNRTRRQDSCKPVRETGAP